MKISKFEIAKNTQKNVREIEQSLKAIGCILEKIDDVNYQVIKRNEHTGLSLTFWQEINEDEICYYAMVVMYDQLPDLDPRFYRYQEKDEDDSYPHVIASLNHKLEKMLLYEFMFHSIYYYESSKALENFNCSNCNEYGYEVILKDGSIAMIDSKYKEFRLIIIDSENNIESVVFDDKINGYVLPVCEQCRIELDYTIEDDTKLDFSKSWVDKNLEGRKTWKGNAKITQEQLDFRASFYWS